MASALPKFKIGDRVCVNPSEVPDITLDEQNACLKDMGLEPLGDGAHAGTIVGLEDSSEAYPGERSEWEYEVLLDVHAKHGVVDGATGWFEHEVHSCSARFKPGDRVRLSTKQVVKVLALNCCSGDTLDNCEWEYEISGGRWIAEEDADPC